MPTRNPLLNPRGPLWDTNSPWEKWPTPKPPQRSSCPKAVKEGVWLKLFGNKTTGKCYACGNPISYMEFEVRHNKPFAKGEKWNMSNLRPICRTCSCSTGAVSTEAFKSKRSGRRMPRKRTGARRSKTKHRAGCMHELLFSVPSPFLAIPDPLLSPRKRRT